MLRRRRTLLRNTIPHRIMLPEANAAARITAGAGIAEAIAAAVAALAAVADAGVAEVVGGTRRPVDAICRLQNMPRRRAANRAVTIEVTIGGATTIGGNSTTATITGGRKGRVPEGLRLPLKRAKNRFFSRANRWQSTVASPQHPLFSQSRNASRTSPGRRLKS